MDQLTQQASADAARVEELPFSSPQRDQTDTHVSVVIKSRYYVRHTCAHTQTHTLNVLNFTHTHARTHTHTQRVSSAVHKITVDYWPFSGQF